MIRNRRRPRIAAATAVALTLFLTAAPSGAHDGTNPLSPPATEDPTSATAPTTTTEPAAGDDCTVKEVEPTGKIPVIVLVAESPNTDAEIVASDDPKDLSPDEVEGIVRDQVGAGAEIKMASLPTEAFSNEEQLEKEIAQFEPEEIEVGVSAPYVLLVPAEIGLLDRPPHAKEILYRLDERSLSVELPDRIEQPAPADAVFERYGSWFRKDDGVSLRDDLPAGALSLSREVVEGSANAWTIDLAVPLVTNDPRLEVAKVRITDADGELVCNAGEGSADGQDGTYQLPLTISGLTQSVALRLTDDAAEAGAGDGILLILPPQSESQPPGSGSGGGQGSGSGSSQGSVSSSGSGSGSGSGVSPILVGIAALLGAAIAAGVVLFIRRPGPDGPGPVGAMPLAGGGPFGGGAAPLPAVPGAGMGVIGSGASSRGEAPKSNGADSGNGGYRAVPDTGVRVLPGPLPTGWSGAALGGRDVRIGELGMHRILPDDGPGGRSWGIEADGVVAIAGWLEKKAGRGEDAEPTLKLHDDGTAILAVYDGIGGAGAATARKLRDGTELSGAYVAARLVRDLVETWTIRRFDGGSPIDGPAELEEWVTRGLKDEASTVPDPKGGVRGSLSKKLPTTMSFLALTPTEGNGTWIDAIWAGDSRSFALTTSNGLQVLTLDDTRESDALALIRNDQPMTNLISADKAFHLNHRTVERSGPAVFLTATDGCFGYVATPAHFEHLILSTLMRSQTAAGWASAIIEELAGFAGDDASFALATTGFSGLSELRRAFGPRLEELDRDHWKPFQDADASQREQLREDSWMRYRVKYEALIAAAPEHP